MERSYTILLDRGGRYLARQRPGRAMWEQPSDPASRLRVEPPSPQLFRERLTAQELQELAGEPDFVAAAEVMSTRLPVSVPAAEAPSAATGRRRQSWGVAAVAADRSKYSGADVTVALLDTGIDRSHTAFRDVELEEKDFTGLGNGDGDGHGTHCAGVLFGRNVDGMRIGVAPGVRRALIGKVLGPSGGDSDMLIRAMAWAHENGAQVVATSVGLDFAATVASRLEEGWVGGLATAVALEAYRSNLELLDQLLQMLGMQEPFTGGAIVVAGAGNDSSRGPGRECIMAASPPCGSGGVISVGAFDPPAAGGFRISSFSNSNVEVTAPGHGIVSASPGGGLKTLSGTSAAASHVAGVAALWWQAVKQSGLPANATLVRGKLLASAEARGFAAAVYPSERGAGRVAAPPDGTAVAPRRAVSRPFAASPLGSFAWTASGGAPRVLGTTDFEPISVEASGLRASVAGSRRLC